jgi:UDP-2,3-diacylglucosamine pyrophosphatase LpxH
MTSMLHREVMDPRPVVPDLVTVPVAAGATVLIASDLHLRADSSSITAHVEEVMVARLKQLRAPAVVVLAGDIIELLGEPGLRPKDAFAAHAELTAAIRGVAATEGCSVVELVGNHDGDLAWDHDAAAEVRAATGATLALASDLVVQTEAGSCKIRVEHGNRFDPYNCFRDIRNPLDTPLGHHVVRELLPVVTQVGQGWLDGATDLADPPDFPSFVGSRLAYRRLAGHLRWLVLPLLALLVLLRVPLVLLVTNRLPEDVQDWMRRTALLGLALIVDVLVVVFIIAVLLRRSWQALRTLDLSSRGWGQNEASRTETARLMEDGYIGLVCGHSHRPEVTAIASDAAESIAGRGFFANAGSCTPVVEAVPGRFGMPPIYLRYLQISWIELHCYPRVDVSLHLAKIPLPGATALERILAKGPRQMLRDPVQVAAWPDESRP